jgi:hypothetical protein
MSEDVESGFRAELHDDRASLRGHGFGVDYRKKGDRWMDAIAISEPWVALATSWCTMSDRGDAPHVANPVYQEVQLHGPVDGPRLCLLLTGLASNHHFSAAVTLSMDPLEPGRVLLDFDVADRCRSPVEGLEATYIVALESGTLVAADADRIAWDIGTSAEGRFELVAGPQASLAIIKSEREGTSVQVSAAIQPGTFTHRLRYGWRWTSAAGLTR